MDHVTHIVRGFLIGPTLDKQTNTVSVTSASGNQQRSSSTLYY
jgi:hypothetical protein